MIQVEIKSNKMVLPSSIAVIALLSCIFAPAGQANNACPHVGVSEGAFYQWVITRNNDTAPDGFNPDITLLGLHITKISESFESGMPGIRACNISFILTRGETPGDLKEYENITFHQVNGTLAIMNNIGAGISNCKVPLIISKDFNFSAFYTTSEYNITGNRVIRTYNAGNDSWAAQWDETGMLLSLDLAFNGSEYFQMDRHVNEIPGTGPGLIMISYILVVVLISLKLTKNRKDHPQ